MTELEKDRIFHILSEEVDKNEYILLNRLTPLFESHGISRTIYNNQGPKKWFVANFPEFTIEGTHGKERIVSPQHSQSESGNTSSEGSPNQRDPSDFNNTDLMLETLDELFCENRYVDFLSSKEFRNIAPQDLPIQYLEMALTCADRLLFPDKKRTITLNSFQKEVVCCTTSVDFIRKWKTKGQFPQEMIKECGESALANFVYPDDITLIVKLLNQIGYIKSLTNNNYVEIERRFISCENELIPHFALFRAFINNTPNAIQEMISEYCQVIKNLKQSTSGPCLKDSIRMCNFTQLIEVIHNSILNCNCFSPNTYTIMISVYFEYSLIEEAKRLIVLWDPCLASSEGRIVDLYFNFNIWNKDDIANTIENGASRELLQRCIALIWGKYANHNKLPHDFIRLLSWANICTDFSSLGEIIRYPSAKGLLSKQKQNMLLTSFGEICEYSKDESDIYTLASYIGNIVIPENDNEQPTDNSNSIDRHWLSFSNDFYNNLISKNGPISNENEKKYLDLFVVFALDFPHYLQLQDVYAEWYLSSRCFDSIDWHELEDIIVDLFSKKAYAAYAKLFFLRIHNTDLEDEDSSSKYIESLINLHRFSEAVKYLCSENKLSITNNKRYLAQVMGENFKENGITNKAFSIFDEHTTVDDMINTFLSEIGSNRDSVVNSLISLYIYKKEFVKAAYLLTIYRKKTDKGYSRLYSQFNKCLGKFIDLQKLTSKYNVVDLAFHVLSPNQLVDFLKWAGNIVVPRTKQHRGTHVFQDYFDMLLHLDDSRKAWILFQKHLEKHGIEKNAWYILICDNILNHMFHIRPSTNPIEIINHILIQNNYTTFAPNFIPCILDYVKDYPYSDICKNVLDRLYDKSIYNCLVFNNKWIETYMLDLSDFKEYCISANNAAGLLIYYLVTNTFGIHLDIQDIRIIANSGYNKIAIFSTVCKKFLANTNLQEISDIIFYEDWSNLSGVEEEILNILRLAFTDDETLLSNSDNLFSNEDTVLRFKRDCVAILCEYPDKSGLFAFDSSCSNEIYKMLVYSFVFNVFYDQDIYEKFDKKYTDFKDDRSFRIYLRFLESSYRAQIIHNTGFPSFYRKWRYLKMYLVQYIKFQSQADDSSIINLMSNNGHYDEFYTSDYLPFTDLVKKYWTVCNLPFKTKEHFLFSILVSHADDFYQLYAEPISALDSEQKAVCRNLVQSLDYRYSNTELLQYLLGYLNNHQYNKCISIAEAVSNYVVDAIVALSKHQDSFAIELFKNLAFMEKPSQTLNSVAKMDMNILTTYYDMVIPLLCARQFIFHINDCFRYLVIKQREETICQRYKYISDYLESIGFSNARVIYKYLYALYYCREKKKDAAKSVLAGDNIFDCVPEQWKKEAHSMYEYLDGLVDEFETDRTIVDGSQETHNERVDEHFAITILDELYDNAIIPTKTEEAIQLNDSYILTLDPWEKVKKGLSLFVWLSRIKKAVKETNLPTSKDLILEISSIILSLDSHFPIEIQFATAVAIIKDGIAFSGREYSARYERIKARFLMLIQGNTKLSIWIKYAETIETFLREIQNLQKFPELRCNIINECAKLTSKQIPYDKKDKKYEILLNSFAGLQSIYATNVMKAIQEEREGMGDGIRLRLIVENKIITNGRIYIHIENYGARSVSFKEDRIKFIFQQEDQPEKDIIITGIEELQYNCVTGGYAEPVITPQNKKITAKIYAFRFVEDEEKETIYITNEDFIVAESSNMVVPLDVSYNTDTAVSAKEPLIGRDDCIERLKTYIPKGVTLIYGPSRIGKTSLMNWIRNRFAVDRQNVITLLFGGEMGFAKKYDYTNNCLDRSKSVPYDNDEKMSQYLLIELFKYGLTQRDRIGYANRSSLPKNLIDTIINVLNDESKTIKAKYYDIDDLLKTESLELWLLFDEFQQVVEQWNNIGSCEFFEICNLLSFEGDDNNKPHNIKLIFCGSDDLVKHMTLEHNSIWKTVFKKTVPVEALKEPFFSEMIKNDAAIKQTNISYSKEALSALNCYTGGVALYGKAICNAILEDIKAYPQKYNSRVTLYTADIAYATQMLLDKQLYEISTKMKEGFSQIYADVTKNLDKDNNIMQMLWYMAKWIFENRKQDGFPERVFTEASLSTEFAKHLYDSLSIAMARGILKYNRSSQEKVYLFTTVFYLYAIYGSIEGRLCEDYIFTQSEEIIVEVEEDEKTSYEYDKLINLLPQIFKKYPVVQQEALLGALTGVSDPDVKRGLKEISGPSQSGTIFNDEVKEVKILQINQQKVFNSLLILASGASGTDILKAIKELPTAISYLDPDSSDYIRLQAIDNRLSELRTDLSAPILIEGASEDNASLNEYESLEREREEILIPCNELREKDIAHGLSNIIMDGSLSPLEDSEFKKQLGFTRAQKNEILQLLNSEQIRAQFEFAVCLHQLFVSHSDELKKTEREQINYCPVALMYCKFIENLLKKLHLPIYINRIGSASYKEGYDKKTGYSFLFQDLVKQSNETESEYLARIKEAKLVIGSFTYSVAGLVKGNKVDENEYLNIEDNNGWFIKKPGKYCKIDGKQNLNSLFTPDDNEITWRNHIRNLLYIQAYRNASAHENFPINQKHLSQLITIIFDKKELRRILEIANQE